MNWIGPSKPPWRKAMPVHKPTYQCYQDMKNRCLNPRSQQYKNYGARGITVCERWLESYENFLLDMGEKPDCLTLERKDNNGNYEPLNCKWATRKEQRNNQRTCRYLEFNGIRLTVRDWAKTLGIPEQTIHSRLHRNGWGIERTLTTPIDPALSIRGKLGCIAKHGSALQAEKETR